MERRGIIQGERGGSSSLEWPRGVSRYYAPANPVGPQGGQEPDNPSSTVPGPLASLQSMVHNTWSSRPNETDPVVMEEQESTNPPLAKEEDGSNSRGWPVIAKEEDGSNSGGQVIKFWSGVTSPAPIKTAAPIETDMKDESHPENTAASTPSLLPGSSADCEPLYGSTASTSLEFDAMNEQTEELSVSEEDYNKLLASLNFPFDS